MVKYWSLFPVLTTIALVITVDGVEGDMVPTKYAKEVVCEGCHAVVSEANKILGKGRRTDRTIQNSLKGLCNAQRLNQYEFSPPTMSKVCDYWTQNYVSAITAALTSDLPEDEQEIELCWITTDICRGVDRSKFRINKYEGPSKRKILAATKAAAERSEEEASAGTRGGEQTVDERKETTGKDENKGDVENVDDVEGGKKNDKHSKDTKADKQSKKKAKKDSKSKGKKKGDEKTKEKRSKKGKARRELVPTKFAKEVVCEGCHAVVAETNKNLGKRQRTDKAVQNALKGLCKAQRLNQYEFSPPTMSKVCDYWTQNYAADITAALTSGLPEDEQEIELCWLTTDICRGVDRSKFRINKYEGPSKRKILAATKAAEAAEEEEEEEKGDPEIEPEVDESFNQGDSGDKEEGTEGKDGKAEQSQSKAKKDKKGKDEL